MRAEAGEREPESEGGVGGGSELQDLLAGRPEFLCLACASLV